MKLAILIQGDRNSGKTTTIKHFIELYSDRRNIERMSKGWNRLFVNEMFKYLNLDMYAIPSSPSESNTKLEVSIGEHKDFEPEVVIIALQPNGEHYTNSLNYLRINHYNILPFTLSENIGVDDWDRFVNVHSSDGLNKLNKRANQIMRELVLFMQNNNIFITTKNVKD